MRVFISYSAQEDQVIALRLQTLASVYGFQAFVPPATTRARSAVQRLHLSIQQEIRHSDLVLAVVNHTPSNSAIAELNYASSLQKMVVPIVSPWVDQNFLESFPKAFVIDPRDPSRVESELLEFLHEKKASRETTNAAVGLTALIVGMLLLSKTK